MVLFVQSVSRLISRPSCSSSLRILYKTKSCLLFETKTQDLVKFTCIRFGSSGIGNDTQVNNDIKYPIKKVELNICSNLYKKWKGKKLLYRNAPENGLDIVTEYADTYDLLRYDNDNNNSNDQRNERFENGKETNLLPTALLLHGAPGSHKDFASLIEYLTKKGIRVIAPTFPDYTFTMKTNVFQHRDEEKTEYLKEFLNAINIKEIDVLIAHSSALFPGINIWKDEDAPYVKALTFFNPAGHRRIKAMRPAWFVDLTVLLSLFPTTRYYYAKVAKGLFNLIKIKVDRNNFYNVILAAGTMYFAKYLEIADKFKLIKEKKTPLLFVFGDNDRLIEAKIFYEMAKILDFDKNDCSVYDKEGNVESTGKRDEYIKVACFRDCGHYAFNKQSEHVNRLVGEFLDQHIIMQSKSNDLKLEEVIQSEIKLRNVQ